MVRSWGEIIAYYQSLQQHDERAELSGMTQLARFIAASSLAPTLFGWTSMRDLCIQQTEGQPYCGPYLRISPQAAGVIEFRYVDTQIGRRQWHREVNPDQAIARLVKFIDQLHWLPGPVALVADLRPPPRRPWQLRALYALRTIFVFKKRLI